MTFELIVAVSAGITALFTSLLWYVNKKLKDLEDQRVNPKPVVIERIAFVTPRAICKDTPEGFPVLFVHLFLHNSGDNPIYLKELRVKEWSLKEKLAKSKKPLVHSPGIRHSEEERQPIPAMIIPPRDHKSFIVEFILKSEPAHGGGPLVLELIYVGGKRTGNLDIEVPNVPKLV